MHKNGLISLIGFSAPVILGFSFASLWNYLHVQLIQSDLSLSLEISTIVSGAVLPLIYAFFMNNGDHEVKGVLYRSGFLGWIFSIGSILVCRAVFPVTANGNPLDSPFGLYLCVLSFFHFSEYFATSIYNPSTLSLTSFLINHSREYHLAAIGSWVEYGIEAYYFPGLKSTKLISFIGLLICISGEIFRKGAMLTAGSSFTHLVQESKAPTHRLITTGIYAYCRHPSYAAWFWWSIGTQILLINPICIIVYSVASWNFFFGRIGYEEALLIVFFGQEYIDYQKKVPRTGVPFVPGTKPNYQ